MQPRSVACGCHSASSAALSAAAPAIAAFRAISSAWRRPPVATPPAPPTPIAAPTPKCSPKCPRGNTDARTRSDDIGDSRRLAGRAGGGPDLRPALSHLHARLWRSHLLRMPIHDDGRLHGDRLRPLGPVRRQSLYGERCGADGTPVPPGLLVQLLSLIH